MKSHVAYAALLMQGLSMTTLLPSQAKAENVTFAVIGPREYELPVNYKDFTVFVQYGFGNFTAQTFGPSGNLTSQTYNAAGVRTGRLPREDLVVGLTKFVYFTTIDALPGVGFALEAIQPEIHLGTQGSRSFDGFGDTIWGGVAWIKPTENSTFGIQTFIQAPIGEYYLTNNYYANLTSILFDAQSEYLSFTGDAGVIFRSRQDIPGGIRNDTPTTAHINLRLGYKLRMPEFPVEPFLAIDHEYNTPVRDLQTRLRLPNSGTQDVALGGGLAFLYDPKQSFTIRYSRSVYGENTRPTDAVYVKYVYIP